MASDTLMESLIEAVYEQPCLWNPLHTSYRDLTLKEAAWQNVVGLLDNTSIPNVKVAKMEWKRLRDNHRDALKRAKLGKNKLLPAQITTWKYAKSMQFLEPYMKYRITENIEVESNTSKRSLSSEHNVSTTEASDSTSRVNGTLGPIVSAASHSAPKRMRMNMPTKSSNTYEAHNTALDAFFNCIRQSTREMPVWLQTHVKKKIFNVIIEAEELMATQAPVRSTPYTNYYDTQSDDEVVVKTEYSTDD